MLRTYESLPLQGIVALSGGAVVWAALTSLLLVPWLRDVEVVLVALNASTSFIEVIGWFFVIASVAVVYGAVFWVWWKVSLRHFFRRY